MEKPVEFTQSLDAFEQKLSAELAKTEERKLQLKQDLLRVQTALPTANEEHANAKAALHRFDIFQQRLAQRLIDGILVLFCPNCYVFHKEESPLVEVVQSEKQFVKYRCNCGYEIDICKIDGP